MLFRALHKAWIRGSAPLLNEVEAARESLLDVIDRPLRGILVCQTRTPCAVATGRCDVADPDHGRTECTLRVREEQSILMLFLLL